MEQESFEVDIRKLLPWSAPRVVRTKVGLRNLLTAVPDHRFFRLWKDHKRELRKVGLSLDRDPVTKTYEVTWWRPAGLDAKSIKESQLSGGETSDGKQIELIAPEGLDYFPFQKNGIKYGMARKNTLIADEMGLGKTVQSIGLVNNIDAVRRFLVVCPMSLKRNWLNEIEKWMVKDIDLTSIERKTPLPYEGDVGAVISYGQMANRIDELIRLRRWDMLVFDECHYLKNEDTLRTQAAMRLRSKRKVMLTGTPVLNRPAEMWTLLQMLDPKTWWSWTNFANNYCGTAANPKSCTNRGELQQRLRSSVMIRRLKKDVVKELPPKMRSVIPIMLPKDKEQAYLKAEEELKEFEDILEKLYTAKEDWQPKKKIPFNEISEIRAKLGELKAPVVADYVIEMLDSLQKVVVFAHHLPVAEAMAEKFRDAGFGTVMLTGKTPEKDRQPAVAKFQDDPDCRVFVGTIGAAGVGHTLTSASDVVFAELAWRPADVFQAEDRCHRIGQSFTVNVRYFVNPGSIDESLANHLATKKEYADDVLDNPVKAEDTPVLQGQKKDITKITLTKPIPAQPDELAVLEGLRMLSGFCDGAAAIDGAGFSKTTARTGKSLARQDRLTKKQFGLGRKICTMHRRQLPEDLVETMYDPNYVPEESASAPAAGM